MKKFNSTIGLVFVAVIVAVTLYSCGKAATENKLLGRWARVNVDNLADTSRVEEWEFSGSSTFRVYFTHVTSADTNYVEGTYTMTSYREFMVSGSTDAGFPTDANGNWRIIKLKKGSLIIVREEGGLTFREFKQI